MNRQNDSGCKMADELLVDYLYDELPVQQRQWFESHLAGCPDHAQTVESYGKVLQAVREHDADVEIEVDRAALMERARNATKRKARPAWIRVFALRP